MELKANELRIGNLVFENILGNCFVFDICHNVIIVRVNKFNSDKSISKVWHTLNYRSIKPIPLTKDWLIRMKDNKNKSTFPDWIKYVHEAQNWYYWNNNKTELIISE